MLKEAKWKSLFRLVSKRLLLLIKKYFNGRRFIPEFVSTLQSECVTHHSERIEQRMKKHLLRREALSIANAGTLELSGRRNNSLTGCRVSKSGSVR
jgi:hypothetical protein